MIGCNLTIFNITGCYFREISKSEFEFKTTIKENHLNTANITHGGYIATIIDSGAGTGAHRAAENSQCVTISLDIKFIGATKLGDKIIFGGITNKDNMISASLDVIKFTKFLNEEVKGVKS